MSIPLDRLYHFIEDIAQHVFQDRVIIYRFYPHGSKNVENMRPLNNELFLDMQLYPSLYCNDQEPLYYDYYETAEKNDYMPFLPPPNLLQCLTLYKKVLLLHSEKKGTNLIKYQQDCFIPVYWWSHAVIALDWFRYAQHVTLHRQSKKTFLIYNRAWTGTREYRLRFIEMLIQENLQELCQSSVNAVDPELSMHYNLYHFQNPVWKPKTVLENYFAPTWFPSSSSADFDIDDYKNTDIEVVLETLFDDDRSHLTEKSLRPIALGQPFILAGTHGSLEYLRSYGFRTFDAVWDESYDTILDPEERLHAITKLMRQIVNFPPEIKEKKLLEARKIADYNKKHFFSKEFFNCVVNELIANLTPALGEVNNTKDYQQWSDRWDSHLSNTNCLREMSKNNPHTPNLSAINHIKNLITTKLDINNFL